MKATMGNTTNTLLLLQVSTRLLLWPIREAKVGSITMACQSGSWTCSFIHSFIRFKLAFPQNHADQEFQVCVEPRKQRYQRQNWLELS